MSRLLLRTLAVLLSAAFLVSLVPAPAAANPTVPYCAGSVGLATMPVTNPAVCETITGRVFPEASPNSIANSPNALPGASTSPVADFVSFFEFQAGLDYLANSPAGQQFLTIHQVGESVGLMNAATQSRDRFPIYMLELTNKDSPVPLENRQAMLFMLSIHGNEKGGREGGFRVLEDLVKGIGMGAEGVQGGAGLPGGLEKPTGGNVETYRDYLDFMRVFLLFPNADGWAHDEADYVAPHDDSPQLCTVFFCRENANGVDLNRQAPTSGWQNPNRNMVGEPEAVGYYNWMLKQGIDWGYAIDIHGMLNHQNFGAIMLPAAAMTPQEMHRSIRLAETLKTRLNDEADGHFAAWSTVFANEEAVWENAGAVGSAYQTVCDAADCPMPGSALFGSNPAYNAGSSQFAEYYTVIDAIGYTDSGFNGDYFAQDSGLNAPGYDIELAYNHITTDSQYEGPGSVFNDYHVKIVREIVKSFMDASALDVKISFETRGLRTLYVEPSFVATSADDLDDQGNLMTPGGWADDNPGDDLWDYGANGGFNARPARYWEDLKPFVRHGDEPGVLVKTSASQLTAKQLEGFDQFVIPGSAIKDLESSPDKVTAVKAWVEAGGNLVLTDEGLRFFDLAGLTAGAVNMTTHYMGGIGITDLGQPVFYQYQDPSDPLNVNVRGGVKQTYEPTPLGFETGANAAPNWYVDEAKFSALGGQAWGYACGTTQISDRCADSGQVGLGKAILGDGQIQFIGSLLPDPTEEFYHPYGLDPYATTYSGNQMLRNMLFWGNTFDDAPVVLTDDGQIVQSDNEPLAAGQADQGAEQGSSKDTPALGLVVLLGALAGLAVVRRRW